MAHGVVSQGPDAREVGVVATGTITLNGEVVPWQVPAAHTSALDWLRSRGLTGAKEGCAEGECGACAVMVARPGTAAPTEWTALNSCLVPMAAMDGQELVTAEGLGTSTALHPVQREMASGGGSQCGYCTPGFVCSMASEFYRPGRQDHGGPDDDFDVHALGGNLCRCTGYRPIRDAARALGRPNPDDPLLLRTSAAPPRPVRTRLTTPSGAYARPLDLTEALDLLADPAARAVAGSTDWGVEVNLRARRAPLVVALDRLDALRAFSFGAEVVELGAALSLTEVERLLRGRIPLLAAMMEQFGSRLVRNAATLGGNLATASPIGDVAPALLALEADLVLVSRHRERVVPVAAFFTGFRSTVLEPGELVRSVRVPLPLVGVTAFHKISKRRFDDISSVAVAHAVEVRDGAVARARIGLGGVAATPLRARATEGALAGQPWTRAGVERAAVVLAGEGTPMDDHRASAAYRTAMLGQSLLRLHAAHPDPGGA